MILIFWSTLSIDLVRAASWSAAGVASTNALIKPVSIRRFLSPVRRPRNSAQCADAGVMTPRLSPCEKFLTRPAPGDARRVPPRGAAGWLVAGAEEPRRDTISEARGPCGGRCGAGEGMIKRKEGSVGWRGRKGTRKKRVR